MKKTFLLSIVLIAIVINVNAQSSYSPEKIGRMMFNAVANGDVSTIKSITTKDFFIREFPMDESNIRASLLSVPLQKREILKKMGNNSIAHTTTIDNECVMVTYKNKTNGKEFIMIMKRVYGNWKVDKYGY